MDDRDPASFARWLALVLLVVLPGCCLSQGGCEATSCREECREDGECRRRTEFSGDSRYRCYADSEEDCRKSKRCEREGACHFAPAVDPGSCVALTVADCQNSKDCRDLGKCALLAGRCVFTEAGCARSPACENKGLCHVVHEPVEGSDTPSLASCGPGNASDEARCREACRQSGACTQRGRGCVATSEEDCRASRVCAERGQCSLDEESGACVAATDEDCRSSTRCKSRELCERVEGGDFCVAGPDACRYSSRCEMRGWCERYKGICRAGSDEDCAASRYCEVRGECALVDHLCRPASEEHCAESLACEIAGLCSFRPGGEDAVGKCIVESSEDCAGSRECELLGRCRARTAEICDEEWKSWCHPTHCAAPDETPVPPCVVARSCTRREKCYTQPGAELDPETRPEYYPDYCVEREELDTDR